MQPPDIRGLSRMKLSKVSQIGILVPNIPEAVAYYTKLIMDIGCITGDVERVKV